MANWIPVSTEPPKPGKYRAKCGVSGDTFWAFWNKRDKRWSNLDGQVIVFGRPECGDVWREVPKPLKKTEKV